MNKEIIKICGFLKQGKTILYPSDTVWGIGCDAENDHAVRRIYEIKKREDSKGLIVLVSGLAMLTTYVAKVPSKAVDLIENTQSPLTIIYPVEFHRVNSQARNLPENVTAKDGSLALRIVKDSFLMALINCHGRGIISTSANLSGNPEPKNFRKIDDRILNQVDYVVNWQQNRQSNMKPSKIIRIELDGKIEIIRE
ncbi:MAG: threonylcarbamoyl-AMP synthase [Cytophagales bacterium]|nr:threonylcarbamoyl-AMP synthase [Cytophagales bacterium]